MAADTAAAWDARFRRRRLLVFVFTVIAYSAYYLVRNSWATNWGEDGYIRLSADANTCGLANEATFATLA